MPNANTVHLVNEAISCLGRSPVYKLDYFWIIAFVYLNTKNFASVCEANISNMPIEELHNIVEYLDIKEREEKVRIN